ncbi:MAG: 3-dehydroquinate dehydratase type I [Candidatus Thalassarchaeaceae archaeon]|jgi:3-dehydroquinate dehydratase type I|tara:strand:+ start:8627 stop:9436 length:810 start_codon:yes stop_codon:yes gene_type:complete
MDMPLVCVSLRGCTVSEVLKDAASATAIGADLVEVRLDKLWTIKQEIVKESEKSNDNIRNKSKEVIEFIFIPQPLDSLDLQSVLVSLKQGIVLPVILTCRPKNEGGHFPGTELERIEVLKQAIQSGVSWIDLELDIDQENREDLVNLAKKGGTNVIASSHLLDQPPNSSEIIQDITDNQDYGDILKICYSTSGRNDGINLFEAAWKLKDSGIKNSIMGLGQAGDWTRIHSPVLGQAIVYSTMENGWHLAQKGMINTADLKTAWEMLNYK